MGRLKSILLPFLLALFPATSALSFTGPIQIGPISHQHGFPIWVQDDAGLRAGPKLPESTVDPAIAGNSWSQLTGFGAEAFWWLAAGDNGTMSIEFAMEAAYAPEVFANNNQAPFARIRVLGVSPNTPATPGVVEDTPETEDWTVTVTNADLTSYSFTITAEENDAGQFEFKNQGADVFFGDAVTGAPPFGPNLVNSPQNTFYMLNPADPNNAAPTVTFSQPPNPAVASMTVNPGDFALVFPPATVTDPPGGIFPNVVLNQAPVALPDTSAASLAETKVLMVLANDTDPIAAGVNEFGINPKGIGLVYPAGATPTNPATPFEIGVEPIATSLGGSVHKNSDGTLSYTAPATATGIDTFEYVIQDDAGCISGTDCTAGAIATPTLVSVAVQDITVTKAELRPKFMKWQIEGTVAGGENSTVTIYAGDDVTFHPVIATNVPTDANGNFTFSGKSSATPGDLVQITVETPELVSKVMNLTYR